MLRLPRSFRFSAFPLVLALSVVVLSFSKIHFHVTSTMVGYEIGQLKVREGQLLERKSLLRMQLSQLTSKRHLELISQINDVAGNTGTFASK